MTRPRTWAVLVVLALAPLGAPACENADDDLLAGKACTPAGECTVGYECNEARVCVPAVAGTGGTGAGADGGAGGSGATTSTGGTGQGGSGGFSCGEDPAPTGGECPAVCTGGCGPDGTTCMIDCAADNACNGRQIQCPETFDCIIECAGSNACKDALIICSSQHLCDVRCEEGCSGAEIQCGDGACQLACSEVGGACSNVDLLCGPDECRATCDGNSQPTVTCGDSCGCSPCSR